MSSVSGSPFTAGVPISASKLNKKTITFSDDVTSEVAIPGQLFCSTSNSGSFSKNDWVARNVDGDGYTLVSQSRHKHNADTNAAGGLLSDIYRANIGQFLLFHKPVGFGPSDLYSYANAVTPTPTIGLDLLSGATKLDTLVAANNYLVSKIFGVSPSLAVPLKIKTKMQFHGNTTNQFVRWGVNMETMDVTNDNTAKIGIESCAATNSNWNIVTADGTLRTAIDAQASLDGTATAGQAPHGFTLEYLPGSFVNFSFDNNIVISKSTNLPDQTSPAGTIPANNVVNYGLKTTDTNSKQLYIWGLSIIGGISDNAWKQSL